MPRRQTSAEAGEGGEEGGAEGAISICHVDRRVWRACGGISSHRVPAMNSRVYYFPVGHLEQSNRSNNVPPSNAFGYCPFVLCRVTQVSFLADLVTDEVFVRMKLAPVVGQDGCLNAVEGPGDDGGERNKVVVHTKVLTPSDANNGGGFSVPRACAESVFPELDKEADPPFQNLMMTDLLGRTWKFRHIYRGSPRRHLLTTGWSTFVNGKKLIAGDSVVFMKDQEDGKMYIGVRRAAPGGTGGDHARWGGQFGSGEGNESADVDEVGAVFSRRGTMMSGEAVMSAWGKASMGTGFEVVYYPRAGWSSDFIVRADVVEDSLQFGWSVGMRVKMDVENEETSKPTSFYGSVMATAIPENGPWRMLEISWENAEVPSNATRVSPWQIDPILSGPVRVPPCPPSKRVKNSGNSGFLTNRGGELLSPMSKITNSLMGHPNPSLSDYVFPAGMQGARQNPIAANGFSNLTSEKPSMCMDLNVNASDVVLPQANSLSVELTASSRQSDNASTDSQHSMHPSSMEHNLNQPCNSTGNGLVSFPLFGAVIYVPVQTVGNSVGGVRDEGLKECEENECASTPEDDGSDTLCADSLGRPNQQNAASL